MSPEEYREAIWFANGYKGTEEHRKSKGITPKEYEVWLRSPSSQQGRTNGELEEQRLIVIAHNNYLSTPDGVAQQEINRNIRVDLHNILKQPKRDNVLERMSDSDCEYNKKKREQPKFRLKR